MRAHKRQKARRADAPQGRAGREPGRESGAAAFERAWSAPGLVEPGDVLALQRSIGNQATLRLLGATAAPRIQRLPDVKTLLLAELLYDDLIDKIRDLMKRYRWLESDSQFAQKHGQLAMLREITPEQRQLLAQIETLVLNWFKQHPEDDKSKGRAAMSTLFHELRDDMKTKQALEADLDNPRYTVIMLGQLGYDTKSLEDELAKAPPPISASFYAHIYEKRGVIGLLKYLQATFKIGDASTFEFLDAKDWFNKAIELGYSKEEIYQMFRRVAGSIGGPALKGKQQTSKSYIWVNEDYIKRYLKDASGIATLQGVLAHEILHAAQHHSVKFQGMSGGNIARAEVDTHYLELAMAFDKVRAKKIPPDDDHLLQTIDYFMEYYHEVPKEQQGELKGKFMQAAQIKLAINEGYRPIHALVLIVDKELFVERYGAPDEVLERDKLERTIVKPQEQIDRSEYQSL